MSEVVQSDAAEAAVLVERRGTVLVITLNRPDARNAVNRALAVGLAEALDLLDADDGLVVGVIAGNGRGFCAGMDLKAFVAGESAWVDGRGFAGIVERSSDKPLIAAVEGFAVAGGLEIALSCDLLVASRGAKLGLPEVKRALVATGGGLRRLQQRVSLSIAMELALTGDLMSAERGYDLGLVNRVVEPGDALTEALTLAEAIAVNGPLAVKATKQIVRDEHEWSDEEFWVRQEEIARPVMDSEDAQEGSIAFAEKRDPVWRGR
jgi:enoyl-CoA hydratase